MPQPGTFIPATLIRETKINTISSNIDKANIFKLAQERKPTDFGPIDLWANKNVKDIPFMGGMIMNGDVTYVNGSYTFSLPTASDTATRIIDAPKGNKVGFGGEEFVIVTNNNSLGGVGAIIAFDKLSNSPELEVTGVKVLDGEKMSYRVKIVNGSGFTDDKFVASELLTSGSKLFKMASTRSPEWGQNWDSFAFKGPSEKKYMKELATAELQVHYNMTRQAVMSANKMVLSEAGMRTIDDLKNNMLEYVFMDSPVDPQFRLESEYQAAGSPGGSKPIGASTLVTLMDDICFKILAREDNEYAMFGKGGIVGYNDGPDRGRLPIGVYHQLDKNGYKDIYELSTFSENTILNAYRRFTSGKMPFVQQGAEPIVRVRTGKGGMELVSPIIQKYAFVSLGGYQQQAQNLGIIEGTARTGLGVVKPVYTRLVIPGQAEFRFEQDPSFDPIFSNDILNPIVGTGYRLSSYTFIIDDYNMEKGNIKILRDSYDERETTWHHVAGTESHPFFKQSMNGHMGHNAAGNATGFSMFFTKTVSTPWVVDPTRLLKLVLKNPKFSNFSL